MMNDCADIKYPVGMQTFSEIREKGFVYVDKTGFIHSLHRLGKYFFLGRPRRFGKSLFISMLQSYYEGRRELFEGLAITDYESNWSPQPVIHLDFTGRNYTNPASLESALGMMFEKYENSYDLPNHTVFSDERFERLISGIVSKTGKKVVILIDEYDKPLLDTVNLPELQENFRNILRGVYGNLKKMDAEIQFAFLTGVSRFGKLNIFSDINNLKDISMEEAFSGICGVTSDEMHRYFEPGVGRLSQKLGITLDAAYELLKLNYDGYHFTEECCPDIYNPFSLLNALQSLKISDYWFETGTPKHLIDIITERRVKLQDLESVEDSASNLRSISFNLDSTLIPLLYQSGYLTIKGYDARTEMLRLGYPNKEVRKGFLLYLMSRYTEGSSVKSWTDIVAFYREIESGKIEDFMKRLQSLYADFNHDGFRFMSLEQHYQDVAYLVFRLLGCLTDVEYKTADGRIDMVIKTENYIYVIEFKRNASSCEAIAQIDDKKYLLPFQCDGRKLVKVGANFDDSIRGLQDWKIEY